MEPYWGMPLLETKDLILRKFDFNDVSDVFNNWTKHEETCSYLVWDPHETIEETVNAVKKWISYYDRSGYYWAIELKESRRVIGNVFVFRADPINDLCEIGVCIGKAFWRHGYAKQSVLEIMKFLFDKVKVGLIIAKHDEKNIASQHLLLSCGLLPDEQLHGQRQRRDGTACNLIYYSVHSANWYNWYNENFKTVI